MTTGKTIALTRRTFVGKVMSLLFNLLSRLVMTFLLRSKHLLISWLQSPSVVILKIPQIKSVTVSIASQSICHEVMGPDAMILGFWMLSFQPTFSLCSFTFIKRLFSFSSFSATRVVSSVYLRLLIDWFQIGKEVRQGCILAPCLFDFYAEFSSVVQSCPTVCDPMDCSMPGFPVLPCPSQSLLKLMSIESVMPSNHLILYAECIMQNARLDEAQAGTKIAGRNINNLRSQWATAKESMCRSYRTHDATKTWCSKWTSKRK